MKNPYLPHKSKILDITKHTDVEWTFKMETDTANVFPGQFYEISIPKLGECPISVSGIGENYVDFTIRGVGKVTNELFKLNVGDGFFMRGPYGNGFDVGLYENKEILVVAGGSAVAPVRGIMNYFYDNIDKCEKFNLIAGFRSPNDVLFKKDFQRWDDKLNVILTVDRAEEDYKGNVGLVTKYIPELPVRDIDNVVAIVVGPPMMMKFTIQEFLKKGIKEENIWVSYERKMCCGLGKCGHCKMDDTYICLEGPVFNYTFAKNLMD